MSVFSRSTIYALAMLAIGACVFLPGAGSATQKQERGVRRPFTPNEPVLVTRVHTKAGTFRGKKLLGDDDWFQGFTVSVKNTSGKVVTHVSVGITFLRPEDDPTAQDPPLSYSLSYGVHPALPSSVIKTITEPPKPIQPGETIDLVLSEESFAWIRRVLKKLRYPESIKGLVLTLEDVGFDDGTMWSGRMFHRDLDNPDKWVPVEDPPGAAGNLPSVRRRWHMVSTRLYPSQIFFHPGWGCSSGRVGHDPSPNVT